jgi:hypothetical protein
VYRVQHGQANKKSLWHCSEIIRFQQKIVENDGLERDLSESEMFSEYFPQNKQLF